ncbi:NIPSNAP family protein [Planctomycetota bacterium]
MNVENFGRRDLLKASGLGAAAMAFAGSGAPALGAERSSESRRRREPRDVYELRRYTIEPGPKVKIMKNFLSDAAIPAMNRIGIKQVGVFEFLEGNDPTIFVLVVHHSIADFASANSKILEDEEFLRKGGPVLKAPKQDPVYVEMRSRLLLAFKNMPILVAPEKGPRLFELRTYQSHNTEMAKRQIHMFNEGGEIAIFKETGPTPVFYGETLVGDKMPNLTYMTTSKDMEEQNAGWERFRAAPKWIAFKGMEKYKGTVSKSTKEFLKPTSFSQI